MAEPTHSYYDWQLSTLLLAYDALEPLSRDDLEAQQARQEKVDKELFALVHVVLPEHYRNNPSEEFPPEVVVLLTRATLKRAAEIVGLLPGSA